MTTADYAAGTPVASESDHQMRDLIVGAVVGAAALWLVPRILDRTVGQWFDGGDGAPEEYDLEV
jgi:hypothetical protein